MKNLLKIIIIFIVVVNVVDFFLPEKKLVDVPISNTEFNERFKFAEDNKGTKVVPEYYLEQNQVILVTDPQIVTDAFNEYYERTGVQVKGLSILNEGSCIIYGYEPEYINDDRMAVLGHEFYHCMRGKFHYQTTYD